MPATATVISRPDVTAPTNPMDHIATISIVTPSYNQGEFLAETIESVIGQAGDFLLDYVVVDGGSTDSSVGIIRHYDDLLRNGRWPVACRGITFRWLSEKDHGQSDALGKGFRLAAGDILAWLNSDDCYLPGTLQAVVEHLRDNRDTALLYGDARYCDREGTVLGSYRTEPFNFDKLAWFNFICQPAAFFRKEVFAAVGGLDESLHFAMDYDLWIRIGGRFTCRYLPVVLATYRLHETSKTVRDETLFSNAEEGLRVAMKYFGWAPLTRVYNACRPLCRSRLPSLLARNNAVATLAAIACSLYRSLRLNRGLRRRDLQLLTAENFRKLFRSRLDIMTGTRNRAVDR